MFPMLNNAQGLARDIKTPQDLFVSVDDDYTMGVNDRIVHVTGFSGAVSVTLPPVSEAVGRAYAIKVLDDSDTNNITIQDQDESRGWSDLTSDSASGSTVLLFSDGETWWQLASSNIT